MQDKEIEKNSTNDNYLFFGNKRLLNRVRDENVRYNYTC